MYAMTKRLLTTNITYIYNIYIHCVHLPCTHARRYYWAITTVSTVGFGDIVPKTLPERCFAIIAEIFGCLMFAVLIGALGSMMVGQKLLEEKVRACVTYCLFDAPCLQLDPCVRLFS